MTTIKHFALLLLTLFTVSTNLANDPLPVDKAFPQEISVSDDLVSVTFLMRENYYLYKHAFKFESQDDNVTFSDPIFPPAIATYDEFMGDVDIYSAPVEVLIPYTKSNDLKSLVFNYSFQGCLKDSICYPPTKKSVVVQPNQALSFVGTPIPPAELAFASDLTTDQSVVNTRPAQDRLSPKANTLEVEDLLSSFGTPDFSSSNSDDEILPVDRAFQLSLDVGNDGTLTANWYAEPGYYLYQDKLTFSSSDPAVALGTPSYPKAKSKYDEIFGDTLVYYGTANIRIPIIKRPDGSHSFELLAKYQGCKDDSICYPPSETFLTVNLPAGGMLAAGASAATSSNALNNTSNLSETDRIAQGINSDSLLQSIFKFLLFGLLLTFTPCVLPMLPILSGIITGTGEKNISPRRAFILSVIYVLAMALVFTVIGIIAALLGQNLQAAFQNPVVIIVFSLLFVALALSMFGLYELQMPAAIQNKLTQISNKQESGSYYGAAIMGALSALIVGPCVTPPLIGAITVIAETGDTLRGGASMFALALGMGIPMVLFGTALGGLVPKAGGWMERVKQFFGVLMLGLAVWMLARILPSSVTLALWSIIAALTAVVFGVFNQIENDKLISQIFKAIGVLALVYAVILLIGSISHGKDPLRPLDGLSFSAQGEHSELNFKRIKSVDDLDNALQQAAAKQQNIFLDFYADWCVACIEMEKYTFSDRNVQNAFTGWSLIQADVTKNDALDKALMQKLGIVGPPAMLFFDTSGKEIKSSRLFGFKQPQEFLPYIAQQN